MTQVVQMLSTGSSAKPLAIPSSRISRAVWSRPTAVQMMPYASLNAMASGVVLRRLLHQWEELVMAAGERADHEQLAGEEREGVGRADLHAELECLPSPPPRPRRAGPPSSP